MGSTPFTEWLYEWGGRKEGFLCNQLCDYCYQVKLNISLKKKSKHAKEL